MRYPIVSFNAGELSPLVDARSDVPKYKNGCRILENMIPRIYGPAERRPGTKYIDTCNGVSRVIPFIYSSEIAYIVLLEDRRMWFYFDGGRVLDADGRRHGIDTPYLAAELFDIHYKQSNDVMWLTHPDHPPMNLSRVNANEFRLEEIVFNDGPFLTRNDIAVGNGIILTPDGTTNSQSGDVTGETGATYTAKSSHDSSTGAARAFDDNLTPPGSYWQPDDPNGEWIYVQYTSKKTIEMVRIAPHVAAPKSRVLKYPPIDPFPIEYWTPPAHWWNPKQILIHASNDGVVWTKIKINGWGTGATNWNDGGAELGEITDPTQFVDLTLDNSTGYFYWRVLVETSYDPYWTMRVHEIEMIESSATFGDVVTITASANVFETGHVGSLWYITQPRADTEVTYQLTSPNTGTSDPILVEGEFTFSTHGTWTGKVSIERSIDQVSYETYRTWTSEADNNVQHTSYESEGNVYYRINVSSLTANTASGTAKIPSKISAELTVNSSTQTGIARATSVVSSTQIGVDVLKPFASSDGDTRWAEGAWSYVRGFPRTMTFFEGRAVYAGTEYQPQTVWLSKTNEFETFWACTKDDSSFSLTMSSDTRNAIKWIVSLETLILGTTGGEWRIRSSSLDQPLTPTNFSMKRQTTYGSSGIQAFAVNDAVLFVDFVNRKVREATYNEDKYKYVANDLTALAEHVTESGITDVAYQQNPDPIFWATRTDGTLLSMTYEREQDVIAWSRHPFEVGPGVTSGTPAIPPTNATYEYAWISQNASLWGVPLADAELLSSFDVGGVARNIGGGLVGLPYEGHPWSVGDVIVVAGTASYNGTYTLQAGTTANELWVTKAYQAETFDGTETVVRKIAIGAGSGRMIQDSDGNLYIGHNWDAANSTFVTKVAPDGTVSYPTLNWPPDTYTLGSETCLGLVMSADERYIYTYTAGINSWLTKLELSTGVAQWSEQHYLFAYNIAIDSSDDVYVSYGGTISPFSPVAGKPVARIDGNNGFATVLTDVGQEVDPKVTGSLDLEVVVSSEYGFLVAGGYMVCATAEGPSLIGKMYNMAVRELDDSAGETVVVGSTYESGILTYTPYVATGQIALKDNYIFVLTVDGPISSTSTTLRKYQWTGSSLVSIASVAGPSNGVGVFFDIYGNLVVVNKNGSINTDTFYYYDTDLTHLSTIDNWAGSMLGLWDAGVGWLYQRGNAYSKGDLGSDGVPAVPSQSIDGLGPNSVATIPSSEEDEVWLVVARQIDGVAKDAKVRYLEQMQPRFVDEQEDEWFVDAGLKYDGVATTTLSNLDHLEGEVVKVLGNGAVYKPQTVTNGSITLDESVTKAIVGQKFRYKLKPMRFDILTSQTSKGSIKSFKEAVVSFHDTLNAEYGVDTDNLFNWDWRTEEAYGSPPELYTGDKIAQHEGGFDIEDTFIITGEDPLPCTVRSIIPRIEIVGR